MHARMAVTVNTLDTRGEKGREPVPMPAASMGNTDWPVSGLSN
jgi:hypothetical protein